MGTEQDGMETADPRQQQQASGSAAAGPEGTSSHVVIENVSVEQSAYEPMSVGEMPQCHDNASMGYIQTPVTSVLYTPSSKSVEPKYIYIQQPQDGATSSTQTGFNNDQEEMEVARSLTELSNVRTNVSTPMIVEPQRMMVQSPMTPKQPIPDQPGSQLFTVTRARNGDINILHDQNVTFQKGEEKLLKKIAKTAVHRPLKGDKDAASASLDSEILDVVIKYEEEESLKKITMKELRHIIPLLIMRCYNISDEPYQRKVRGMWTEKPEYWPENIPYCDPNNKKESGKPKKDTLLDMFKHLRHFYTINYPDIVVEYKQSKHGIDGYVTSEEQILPAGMEALEAAPASPSMTGAHPAQPSTTLSYSHPVTITTDSPVNMGARFALFMEAQGNPPKANVKQELDPEQQILERINGKLKRMVIEKAEVKNYLQTLHDILDKIFLVRSQDHVFYLQVAHDYELLLDVLAVTGNIPESFQQKWNAFYHKHSVVPDPVSTEQVQVTLELQDMQEIGREEEVATDNILIISKDSEAREPQPYLTTSNIHPSRSIVDVTLPTQTMPPTQSPQIIDQSKLNMEYQQAEPNNVLKTGGGETDILSQLVANSLFVAEDVNTQPLYTIPQPPQMKVQPPQTEAPPPSQLQAEDISDMFPLSCQTDLAQYYADDNNSVFFEIPGDTDSPSTNLVTLENTHDPTTTTSTSATSSRVIMIPNLSKLRVNQAPTAEDDKKLKAMAAAFYNINKNGGVQKTENYIVEKPLDEMPSKVLNTSPWVGNPVIPSVVEDLEKSLTEEEPIPRKRIKRYMKRPLPATTLNSCGTYIT